MPVAGEGTSIDALSDSSNTSESPSSTLAPTATKSSTRSAPSSLPKSGIMTSIDVTSFVVSEVDVCVLAVCSSFDAAVVAVAPLWRSSTGAGDRASSPPAVSSLAVDSGAASSSRITSPSETVSPTATRSSVTTPAWGAGISIEALSDSTTIRLCSTSMVSPGATKTSTISAPSAPPISGILIGATAMSCLLPDAHTRIGLGLLALMPRVDSACSTTASSRSP